MGVDAGALATLKPYADQGAPTSAALAAEFEKLAPGFVAPESPEAGEGFVDRLLERMRRLVKVRKVGETAGDDPAALASQIAAALGRGDVAGALTIYAKLPESARSASADWAKSANALAVAEAAARGLRQTAIARLAAAKN